MKTILASASPRRRELLALMGVTFDVCPAKGEEVVTKTVPKEIVQELAYQKAAEIAKQKQAEYGRGDKEFCDEMIRIIGSDTIVVYKNEIFGKPKDEDDALRMLTALQGNIHQVYTGVCVIDLFVNEEPVIKTFAEKTDVTMYPVTEREILDYIATGESMDKAGAYAIQGISSKFIKEIKGDYYNVVGLPLAKLYQECYKK